MHLNNLVQFCLVFINNGPLTHVLGCSRAPLADEICRLQTAVGRRAARPLSPLTSHPHHRKPDLRGNGLLSWPRELLLARSASRSLPAALASTLQPSRASYDGPAYRAT